MAKRVPLPEKYPLPGNWTWVDMGQLADMKNGFPFNSKRFSHDPDGRRPLIRIRDVLRGETATYTDEPCPEEYLIHAGEILIGMDGDFNAAKWNSADALLNQRVCRIESNSDTLLNEFLFYYLPIPLKSINDVTPSMTVKHLSTKTLSATPFPLPPLPEQKRVVERLESLFTRLDEARDKAQAVLDGYEYRRAAILHKAFTGELTAKWRAQHGVELDSWTNMKFIDCIQKMQNGIAKRSGKTGSPVAVLRLANLSDEGFVTDNLREIPLDEKEQFYYELRENDVIMIRVNGSRDNVGKQYLISSQKGWAFCDHLIRIVYNGHVLPAFMLYFSRGLQYRIYVNENMVTTAGQNTISRKGMSNLFVPVPPITEQGEIVRILDKAMEQEKQARESAERVLEAVDLMKKSILIRAFRGQLGTNNPEEPCACVESPDGRRTPQ